MIKEIRKAGDSSLKRVVSRQCPKCKSRRVEKLGEIVGHYPKPKGGWTTYKCCDCWECLACKHLWSVLAVVELTDARSEEHTSELQSH